MKIKYYLISIIVILCLFKPIKNDILRYLIDKQTSICTNSFQCFTELLVKKGLCKTCTNLLPLIRIQLEKGNTEEFENIILLACVGQKSTNYDMCSKIISTYKDIIYKVSNESTLTSEEICYAWLDCGPVENKVLNWDIELPNIKKPKIKQPNHNRSQHSNTLRILHLADIHIDFEYQPYSLADCDQYLCCRNSSSSMNQKYTQNRLAGYWGDYRNCDIPLWTVENMFQQISNNEKFDVIYWTGDLAPHIVWESTKSDQLYSIKTLTQLFKKYFPNKKIYSSVGNHESSPHNLFSTNNNHTDMSWLFNDLSEEWVKIGLPNDTVANIKKGAFYTTVIYPGLRLVSLNNIYCYKLNFWLYINSTDPYDQLDWLAKTLQASENIGEKVNIIAHINPSACLKSFSRNYYKIVNRYEHTIVGQFFGHTHFDHLEIFYDLENKKRAVNVAYIAGSTTTYRSFNPSYRIYTLDGVYENSTFQVLDYETYIMNITEANLGYDPIWIKEYSAKEDFKMKNLSPVEWNKLINKITKNLFDPLFDKLYKFYYKLNADPDNCDSSCRRSFVCKFKQASSEKNIPC